MEIEYTHGSLFSGIGGFDLAAEWAGFKNIFHCEIEEYKRHTLKQNFKNANSYADIREFDGRPYRNRITVLSGGFPCQDISVANNKAQGITGERSGLWKQYARLLGEIRPKCVLFENSPMLLVRGFEHVLCDLSKLGYNCEWKCFYASDFGFPHFRKRLYGLAYSAEFRQLHSIKNDSILQKILPERSSRLPGISMPTKRYDRHADFESVRMDDGFSYELDKEVIHGFGNAVVPQIPYEIFKLLKQWT